MRSINSLIRYSFWGLSLPSLPTPPTPPLKQRCPTQGAAQVIQTMADGTPPMQEQVTVLDPFFLIRQKDAKVWVERIIVTLALTTPKPTVKHDLNGPMFRKIVYDLVQSGKPEDSMPNSGSGRFTPSTGNGCGCRGSPESLHSYCAMMRIGAWKPLIPWTSITHRGCRPGYREQEGHR
jgi:hypothetical protein